MIFAKIKFNKKLMKTLIKLFSTVLILSISGCSKEESTRTQARKLPINGGVPRPEPVLSPLNISSLMAPGSKVLKEENLTIPVNGLFPPIKRR